MCFDGEIKNLKCPFDAKLQNIKGAIHDQGTTFGTKDLRTRHFWACLGYLFFQKKRLFHCARDYYPALNPNRPDQCLPRSVSALVVVSTRFAQLSSLALCQSFPPSSNLKSSSPSSQSPSSLLPSKVCSF